jgi:Zn-dependent protease
MLMFGLHEGGHLLAAKCFKLKTGGFYFLPIGGISLIKEEAKTRWQDFWIYFGGPFVGALLVLFLYLFLEFFGSKLTLSYQIFALSVIFLWSVINLFNLLPIFPLDGGGMLWAIAKSLWKKYSPYGAIVINCLVIGFFWLVSHSWFWTILLLVFGFYTIFKVESQEKIFKKLDMKKWELAFCFVSYLSLIFFFAFFTWWSGRLVLFLKGSIFGASG